MASMLWAAAAIADATPSDARALTGYSGQYASCSTNYEPVSYTDCGVVTSYQQTIKMVTNPCSSGACSANGVTKVESVYSSGRKVATLLDGTCWLWWVYEFGACAC